MKSSSSPRKRPPPALSLLAGIILAAGMGALGGCAQSPAPYNSVLSGHPPLPPDRPLSREEQRRYADINSQVARDEAYRAAREQGPKLANPSFPYNSVFPSPLSLFGGFSSGRGPRWGGGGYGGLGRWW